MGSLHVKFHDDRCKKKAVMRRKPFSVIYALWPWPLNLKIYRAHPWLMGHLHVKFHDDRCKGKAVMCRKPFSVVYALWPWPLDLKIYGAHSCLMRSLHVKFHDDRCKGKAVMHRKPFSVIYALSPWPLTSKSIGHILASWGVCMWSFMVIGVKGKQLCAGNPNAAGQTDGRTDRGMDGQTDMVIPVYPPNFVAGGIISIKSSNFICWGWNTKNTHFLKSFTFSSSLLHVHSTDFSFVSWLDVYIYHGNEA